METALLAVLFLSRAGMKAESLSLEGFFLRFLFLGLLLSLPRELLRAILSFRGCTSRDAWKCGVLLVLVTVGDFNLQPRRVGHVGATVLVVSGADFLAATNWSRGSRTNLGRGEEGHWGGSTRTLKQAARPPSSSGMTVLNQDSRRSSRRTLIAPTTTFVSS